MGKLRFGDVYERDVDAGLEIRWKLKPRWKIWLAWFLRLLGWDGEPS